MHYVHPTHMNIKRNTIYKDKDFEPHEIENEKLDPILNIFNFNFRILKKIQNFCCDKCQHHGVHSYEYSYMTCN